MRILNRLLAFIVALALAAASAIVILEVIAARSKAAPLVIDWPSILNWGRHNTWKATSVELTCAIVTAAGLLLLIPQLLPRRLTRLALHTDDATDAALSRKGLAVTVRGAVDEVEGVVGARVKVKRHRVKVDAFAAAVQPETADQLEPQVEAAASEQLNALRLVHPHRLRISVSNRSQGGS